MIDFLKTHGIAVIALVVSIFALYSSNKTSRLNSYNQHGSYLVLFQKISIIKKWLQIPQFFVETSDFSEPTKIAFDYSITIKPLIGGIYKANLFDILGEEKPIGTIRTFHTISNKELKKFPKRHANQDILSFSSSPMRPYFSVNGEYNESEYHTETKLCRYHRYLDITDYCGNTQIWYISFSLQLSNLIEDKSWKKCDKETGFEYYKFNDLNIVSLIDLPKNLNRLSHFDKNSSIISETQNEFKKSEKFIEQDFDKTNAELQLYEMNEYIKFLDKSKKYI